MSLRRWRTVFFCMLLGAALSASAAGAQQILLDKPTKAGELNLFPDLNDANVYYYVPDQVRLATNPDGSPQFSFIRYVQNVRSGADQPEAKEGVGGGIVHALVTLGVSPEQLATANRELRRLKPSARIEGPVMFKSGRFTLESAYADGKGNMSTQVLGLGSAPLLDGEKASISIELTKKGSILLWNAFDTAAPGIAFHFEMDMGGFQSPRRATIHAEWSQIYSHRAFGAGLASTYLAAEIKDAFDELRKTNAIKITQVGEDAQMEGIVASTYKMLQDLMFEPVGGTGTPDIGTLAASGEGQPGLLDRATARLKEARDDVDKANVAIRGENKETQARNDQISAEQSKVAGARTRVEVAESRAAEAAAKAEILAQQAQIANEEAQQPRFTGIAGPEKIVAILSSTENAKKEAEGLQKEAEAAKAEATRLQAEAEKIAATSDTTGSGREQKDLKSEETKPTLSLIATLEMKKVKQSGVYDFDMNKFMPDVRTLAFSEEIGDMRGYKNNPDHFKQINMDDPLFRQRELVAMVDIANAQDFGQFVNFVDVQMRKKHAGGEPTTDEVRIDRTNFNKEGNNFKLMYGWNGDTDQSHWSDYELQKTWSLIGGKTVVEPWKLFSAGTINLAPPYRRRTVTLDGNPDSLQQRDVRSVTVQLFYDVAGSEQSKQVTLNVAKGQVGDKMEFLSSPESPPYAYQMTWQLKGNKTLSSPRQNAVSDMLYVDELPGR